MNQLTRIFMAAMAAVWLMAAGCARQPSPSVVAEAQEAVARGEYEQARSLCDRLLERVDEGEKISGLDAAKASIIYIKVADAVTTDDGETVGQAIRAYNIAMEQDPDSAGLYYATVPAQDTRHVKMLLNVVRGLELPDSLISETEE